MRQTVDREMGPLRKPAQCVSQPGVDRASSRMNKGLETVEGHQSRKQTMRYEVLRANGWDERCNGWVASMVQSSKTDEGQDGKRRGR